MEDDGLCTVAWAAELLGLSQRQVMRYVEAGVLKLVRPKVGTRESSRHKQMLRVAQVREVATARTLMRSEPRS